MIPLILKCATCNFTAWISTVLEEREICWSWTGSLSTLNVVKKSIIYTFFPIFSTTETFQFISRRHYGFPFSLTFYLNGIQVDRLSSCCEYKHRKGTRLGGKHGYFGFINVERSSPCYRYALILTLINTKPELLTVLWNVWPSPCTYFDSKILLTTFSINFTIARFSLENLGRLLF